MYLIDTNIVSEVGKGIRCDIHVANWYSEVDESLLYISSLSLGEIRRGIELVRRRGDPAQANSLEIWLQTVKQQFSNRVLDVDSLIAETWGEVSALRPIPAVDGLLAATAKVHNLTLVTRNIQDVQGLGVNLLNPFSSTTGGN